MLSDAVTENEKKKKQKHRVFEDSFDVKRCFTDEFIIQKLNYIHNNPVQPKWSLASSPSEYKHSSALFYETDDTTKYEFSLVNWQQRR